MLPSLHPEDGGNMPLWNGGILTRHYTASQSRRTRVPKHRRENLKSRISAVYAFIKYGFRTNRNVFNSWISVDCLGKHICQGFEWYLYIFVHFTVPWQLLRIKWSICRMIWMTYHPVHSFHGIWYGRYPIRGHPNLINFNFLRSVNTTWHAV